MPMLFCLLGEIGEIPPADFLAAAQMKAAQRQIESEKKGALQTMTVEKGKVRRRKDGD